MIKQTLIIGISILVFTGCSKIFTPLQSNKIEQFQEKQSEKNIAFVTPNRKENVVKKEEIKKIPKANIIAELTPKPPDKTESTQTIIHKPVKFAENETQHVRLAHYNPFENGNKIELNLESISQEFCYPYNGKAISRYGYRGRSMHTGLDIKAIPRDSIRAILPGVVRMSKYYSGYGNVVVIRHYNGLESVYSHNSKNIVFPNDIVEAGTVVGLAGRTGSATTEHVHFELRVMGEHFNPELMLDSDNRTIRKGKLFVTNNNGKISASSSSYTTPSLTKETTAASSKTYLTTNSKPSASTNTHTIKKGDTLYNIAKRYNTTVKSICTTNNFKENKTLKIGEKIKIN